MSLRHELNLHICLRKGRGLQRREAELLYNRSVEERIGHARVIVDFLLNDASLIVSLEPRRDGVAPLGPLEFDESL